MKMAAIYTNFKLWMRGLFSAHDVPPEVVEAQVNGMFEVNVQYVKAAVDGAAATATAADFFYVADRDRQVVDADFIAATPVAANDTNFATIIVNKHDGAGGAAVVAASRSTTIAAPGGPVVAGIGYDLTLSATLANTQLTAGNVLSFQITKTGGGAVVPAGYVRVVLRAL
jgi:hypothetical protein